MCEEFTSDECEEAVDELLSLLGNIPKERITMLNMPRYSQAVISIDKIVKLVKEDSPDAEIEVEFDEMFGTCLCLRIVVDQLNIYNAGEFGRAIEAANTMDVIPRLDGKIKIGFTYKRAKIPVPPATE